MERIVQVTYAGRTLTFRHDPDRPDQWMVESDRKRMSLPFTVGKLESATVFELLAELMVEKYGL